MMWIFISNRSRILFWIFWRTGKFSQETKILSKIRVKQNIFDSSFTVHIKAFYFIQIGYDYKWLEFAMSSRFNVHIHIHVYDDDDDDGDDLHHIHGALILKTQNNLNTA